MSTDYISEFVKTMVDTLKDKIVIVDFDGVLIPFRATSDRTIINTEDYIKCQVYDPSKEHKESEASLFKSIRVPFIFKELVSKLDSKNIYVLTECASSFEWYGKLDVLRESYSNIRPENVMFTGKRDYKIHIVNELYNKKFKADLTNIVRADCTDESIRKNIVLIEDNLDTIKEFEDQGFTCIHASNFIV